MKNIKNKLKQIPLIFSVIFFIFSAAVFFFLHKQINNKYRISQEAQVKWQQEEHRRNNMKSLERLVNDTKDEQALVEKHFVYGSDVVPFLDMIENLAPRVGVEVEVVSVDLPKDNSSLTVDLKVKGPFESIYKFIKLLENSSYELGIIGMDIKKEGIDNDLTARWVGTLKVKVLSFIP